MIGQRPHGWGIEKRLIESTNVSRNVPIQYKSLIVASIERFEICIYNSFFIRRLPHESVREFVMIRLRKLVPELKTLDHKLEEYIATQERACFSSDEFSQEEYENFVQVLLGLETYVKNLVANT